MTVINKVFYAQCFGDKLYKSDKNLYSHVLLSSECSQPVNLSISEKFADVYDYTKSDEIHNVKEAVVLQKDFILVEELKNIELDGLVKAVASVSCAGDESHTTTITAVEFIVKSIDKRQEKVILTEKYNFANPISNISRSYTSPVSATMDRFINRIMKKDESLILTIKVHGMSDSEEGDNRVVLIHPRGEDDTHLVLPVKYLAEKELEKSTFIVDYDNRVINNYEAIIDKVGAGVVHNFVIKSTSSLFGVSIIINEDKEYKKSMSELIDISDELSQISAYYLDSYYHLSISNIKFNKSIKFGVYATSGGSFTFKKIHAKYEV